MERTIKEVRVICGDRLSRVDAIACLAAEQKITPWEEDSTISQCPLCL